MNRGLFFLPLAADATEVTTPTSTRCDRRAGADSFVAGPENALLGPLAAAIATPQLVYNPILLYGLAGVGKSSVAQALAAKRSEVQRLRHIISTTGTELAQALAHAIDTKSADDFRARFLRCDLLLVDDVHRLAGHAAAQGFLRTVLDGLIARGSLVIVTLRCGFGGPKSVDGLQPALASRLSGGLVARLAPPGALARRELIKQAAAATDCPASEEAIESLCLRMLRRDEFVTAGKLRRAVLQLATGTMPDACGPRDLKLEFRRITSTVAKQFGLTAREMKSTSRQQAIVEARGIAMHLARRLTGASFAEIGCHFGGRDHTTVLHACRRVKLATTRDPALRRLVDELATSLAATNSG